jgi:pyruvate kinase
MIVVSNHLRRIGVPLPKDAVVRLNLAWIASEAEVDRIVADVKPRSIWMDYPISRTKPPKPSLTIGDAVRLANRLAKRVSHFAYSNAEDIYLSELLRMLIPESVKLVPKIETRVGVANLIQIVRSAKTDTIMLDKEDLYIDCGADIEVFNPEVEKARKCCQDLTVTCLELKGVVFA